MAVIHYHLQTPEPENQGVMVIERLRDGKLVEKVVVSNPVVEGSIVEDGYQILRFPKDITCRSGESLRVTGPPTIIGDFS